MKTVLMWIGGFVLAEAVFMYFWAKVLGRRDAHWERWEHEHGIRKE